MTITACVIRKDNGGHSERVPVVEKDRVTIPIVDAGWYRLFRIYSSDGEAWLESDLGQDVHCGGYAMTRPFWKFWQRREDYIPISDTITIVGEHFYVIAEAMRQSDKEANSRK